MSHIIIPSFPAHMDPDTIQYLRDLYEQLIMLHNEILALQSGNDEFPFTVEGDEQSEETE